MNQIMINTESHKIEYEKQTFDYHEWGGMGDYAHKGLYFTTSWQELMEEATDLRKRKGFTNPPCNQAELVEEALMDRIYG